MKVDFETELRGATVTVEADMSPPEPDVGIFGWCPNGFTVRFVYRPDEPIELTDAEEELLVEEAADLADGQSRWDPDDDL